MADKNFGRVIEDRRRELGLTQEIVAKKVGVRANYVGYLERGMRHPSQKVVEKLSRSCCEVVAKLSRSFWEVVGFSGMINLLFFQKPFATSPLAKV